MNQNSPAEAAPDVGNEAPQEETQQRGYGGAAIRSRRDAQGAGRPQTYAEWQTYYAQKRGKSGKRRLVICAIPIAAIILVGLLGYRSNQIAGNDSLEPMISDEVLQDAQVVDLNGTEPFDGMSEELSGYVRESVRLINAEREANGLKPLVLEERMRKAAQTRAEEGVETLSHTRPDGSSYRTALSRNGVESGFTGENLGTGFQSPEAFVKQLMKSSTHKAYLLSETYEYIGVGVVQNPDGAKYKGLTFCQLFAR